MEGEDEDTGTERAFSRKKPLPKIIILCAGAAMNILLGFLMVTVIVSTSAVKNGGVASTVVETVNPEAQAAQFLQPGDKIVKVNDTTVHIKRDISFELSNSGGGESTLEFIRNGERHSEKFIPMEIKNDDNSVYYAIGFNVRTDSTNILNILHESLFRRYGWLNLCSFRSECCSAKGECIGYVRACRRCVGNEHRGTERMAELLFFAAFLTVNIGVMNLLPLPALDGGRTVFALVELISGKAVPAEKEGIVHLVGFVLLIGLMIFVTWNDISRLISG